MSLSNIRWFTERESQILVNRVVKDDPTKHQNAKTVTKAELKRTLTNWRLLPHVFLTICGLSPCTTLLAYGPSLVAEWGYGRLRANAIVSIGPWCMVVLNVCWGLVADKISLRGPVVSHADQSTNINSSLPFPRRVSKHLYQMRSGLWL